MGIRALEKGKNDKTERDRGKKARNSIPAWKQQGEEAEPSLQSLAEVRVEGTREPGEGTQTEAEKTQKQRVPETELTRGL